MSRSKVLRPQADRTLVEHDHAAGTLVSRLAGVVEAQLERPALLEADDVWSYRELWARTERVARALLERGVEQGSRVGLVGGNSADYIVAYFGIMRAGSAAVVPNPLLGADELRRHLQLAETATTLLGELAADTSEALTEGAGALPIADLEAVGSEPLPSPAASDAALLIPATGSTGEPKSVVLTHATMVHAADQLASAFPTVREDVTISLLPLHASIYKQVIPIVFAGGAVDVLPRYDPEAVSRACGRGTTSDAVPPP
ncbi:MAG: AMP-binding protein [Actinomycetia bacterium]|nr:AMP-binding protein [Actinomycetes bacterium]